MSARRVRAVRVGGRLLVVAAVVLAIVVWVRVTDTAAGTTVGAGDARALDVPAVGVEHTVLVPSVEATIRVAPPTSSIEVDDTVVRAPEGGRLIPVSWQVRSLTGYVGDPVETPTELTLVAGGRRFDLASVSFVDYDDFSAGLDVRSLVLAVEGALDLPDVTVEVEFDGHTQVLHPATGEIDAGVAQALYERPPTYTPDCGEVPTTCDLTATDPGSPLRPAGAGYTASAATPFVYSSSLGWAEEGRLWLRFRIQVFGASSVVDADGGYRFVEQGRTTAVLLDGVEAVERDPLGDSQLGYATFSIDPDQPPRELVLEGTIELEGRGEPRTLDVRSVRELRLEDLG